ncbi:MAG: hypothetical protein F6K36_03325 [Symploca sp. SIO3C6]|uniref:Uncharacterized protein n=1 Tax=Symploca sp. SIO1C4 TaxID=2607765 RepID=A0A6B3N9S4_9CYAN|nr:hypothetical protein [Symploca sp. SIO3C6]NER28417.1 hypothetical protein [Symploca sp. SIO1C4]
MSKKICLNQGWYLKLAGSLALVAAIYSGAVPKAIAGGNNYALASTTDVKSTNSSDVKTKQSPWDELKTDNTTEAQQETTTTDTQQKTNESSELEQKQGTPTLSHNPCIKNPCNPAIEDCWICDD